MKLQSIIIFALLINIAGCKNDNDHNILAPDLSSILPPDPGRAGKKTLEGIDSDKNDIRDDVQIAIYKRYPNDELKRQALEQAAKTLQLAVIAGNALDKVTVLNNVNDVIRFVDCFHIRMSDPTAEISFIENAVINTNQRTDAYINYNQMLSGQFFGEADPDTACD